MKPTSCVFAVLASLVLSLSSLPAGARDFVLGGSVLSADKGPVGFSLLANERSPELSLYYTSNVFYRSEPSPTFPGGVSVRGLFSSGNTVGNGYTLPGFDLAAGGFSDGFPKHAQLVFQLSNYFHGQTPAFSSVSTADPSGWVDANINPGESWPNQALAGVKRGSGFVDVGFPAAVGQAIRKFLDFPVRVRVFNACVR